jgi:monofunctional biosynthetic peptidoglycan transglycosylase
MARRLRRLALRLGVLLLVLGAGLGLLVYAGLPSRAEVRRLSKQEPARTALMQQREAEARARKRTPRVVQRVVPLSRISPHLVNAVVTAEDARFFGHGGVDWQALRESAERDWRQGRFVRGGSTITQQLAKNLYFSTHKSLLRKLRELVVARWLEQDLPKRRILELYLNVIEWGDEIYGCEAAAQAYYGKSAAALDLREAAGLAAMIPNPRRINPKLDPARHARAQARVLWLMGLAGQAPRGVAAAPTPEPVEEEEAEPPAAPRPESPTESTPEPGATPSDSSQAPAGGAV